MILSLRPVLWPDVRAVALALFPLAPTARAAVLQRMLQRAEAADLFRKRYRRWHARWGNGSLAGVAGPHAGPEPLPGDAAFANCIAEVFSGLVIWRAQKAALNRRRRTGILVKPDQN